jgi:hypothetical protein
LLSGDRRTAGALAGNEPGTPAVLRFYEPGTPAVPDPAGTRAPAAHRRARARIEPIRISVYRGRMRDAKPVLRLLLILGLAAGIVGVDAVVDTASAEARRRPAARKQSNFQANKTFGLGIMLGAPTGLSGKYYLGPDTALDFGIGGLYGYHRRRGLHLHADYLWHPVSLVSADAFELPLYVGVGGRFFSWERYYRDDRRYYGGSAVGVRVPVGIAFDFNDVPIDIFIELAFVVDFIVRSEYRDDPFLGFDVNPAIGFRYYFN